MVIFQMSSSSLQAQQRKSASAVKVLQEAKQSVAKQQGGQESVICPTLVLRPSPNSEMDSTSDADGPESEEENPYPLEGKYTDEYDRQRYIATLSPCIRGPAKSFIGFWKCPK